MPISKSAKKTLRASERKHVFNLRRNRTMKDVVKETRALAASGNTDEAKAKLSDAYKAIDKAAKGGLIKKNTAARKKSRLSAFIKRSTK